MARKALLPLIAAAILAVCFAYWSLAQWDSGAQSCFGDQADGRELRVERKLPPPPVGDSDAQYGTAGAVNWDRDTAGLAPEWAEETSGNAYDYDAVVDEEWADPVEIYTASRPRSLLNGNLTAFACPGVLEKWMQKGHKKGLVVNIGYHKTATSTWQSVMKSLGWTVTRPSKLFIPEDHNEEAFHKSACEAIEWAVAEGHNAVQDTPWFWFYREWVATFPEAKFVLIYREPEGWYRSAENFFIKQNPWRVWKWGEECPIPYAYEHCRARYLYSYNMHLRNVRALFSGELSSRYLELNITALDKDSAELHSSFVGASRVLDWPRSNAKNPGRLEKWKQNYQ